MTAALQTVLQLAERRRDQSMTALLQAEEQLRRLRLQEQQLLTYRAEYENRDPARQPGGTGREMVQTQHQFLQRLQQAVTQQQAQLQVAEQRIQGMRQDLVAQETHIASVRKLIERRQQVQVLAQGRLEQRRSDDAALQRLWHQRAAAQPPH